MSNIINKELVTEIAIDRSEIAERINLNFDPNIGCVFLVAGRMIYRKGHDFLLDALACIPDGLKYQCRIVGGGPEMEHFKGRCKRNKLSQHVIFTGMIPFTDMEKEYENADVFIMPSLRETTGSVLLEAMSKSMPIVTINKFGGATLLDKNTGWLYSGNTKEEYIESLKNALVECITQPEEVMRRGKNARMLVEKYTWEEKVKHYNMIYQNLIKE